MFKISKLTDYGTVVMTTLAKHPGQLMTANDITELTLIPLPTVTKVLKLLTRGQLLVSHRGASGGYTLNQPADTISVAAVIRAIEGELGLTECAHASSQCFLEPTCATRLNWQLISQILLQALENISILEMSQPLKAKQFDLSALQSITTPIRVTKEINTSDD